MLLCCLSACSQENILPNNTTSAMKMYEKYSGRQNLNVAMIGNYNKGGNTYNALMLHAMTDDVWDSLIAEFGIEPLEGFEQITSLTSTRLASSGEINDLHGLSEVIADSIIIQISNAIEDHKTHTKKTHVKNKTTGGDNNTNFDRTVASNLKKGIMSGIINSLNIHIDSDLAKTAFEEGMIGYVIHQEIQDRTIWLFFYDSQESYYSIMHHVENNSDAKNSE